MKSSHDPTNKPALFTDQLRAASRGIHANNTAVVATCASSPELQLLGPVLPSIQRGEAFREDINFFLGDWHEKPSSDVAAYLSRLQTIAQDDPVLLLAHCWAQYAALLAGGQIIQRMVRRALQLGTGPGTAAFSFEEPTGVVRQKLKNAVNAAPLSDAQRQRVMHEHCLVFQLNSNIVKGFKIEWNSIFAQHRTAILFVLLLVMVVVVVSVCLA